MKEAMKKYLEDLITAADPDGSEGGVSVQIVFEPGAGQTAGGLRHALSPATKKPIPGLYELCTMAKPGPDAPLEIRGLDHIVISQVFDAEAVQRVITQFGGPEKPTVITTRQ